MSKSEFVDLLIKELGYKTCLHCKKEYRTEEADHMNPHSPYCSFACHKEASVAARELGRRNHAEDHNRYARSARLAEVAPGAILTCPHCSRKLESDTCYKCHRKS